MLHKICLFVASCLVTFAGAAYWNHPGDTALVLEAGGSMRPLDAPIFSPSGKYKVQVEASALVVSLAQPAPTVVWSTMADGHVVDRLQLTERGNLYLWGRLLERTNARLWRSNTPLTRIRDLRELVLSLSDDGYLQLSVEGEVYWESAGLREYACLDNATLSNVSAEILRVDQVLIRLQKYYSPSRNFYLTLQSDGNLVLYRACDDNPTWSSYTHSANPDNVTLTRTGEFVYHGDMNGMSSIQMWFKEPQFKYSDIGRPNSKLRLANNGRLYLCQGEDCYWQSGFQDPDVDNLTQPGHGGSGAQAIAKAPVSARATSSAPTSRMDRYFAFRFLLVTVFFIPGIRMTN